MLKDSGMLNMPQTKKRNSCHYKIAQFIKERNDKLRKRNVNARRQILEIINYAKIARVATECKKEKRSLAFDVVKTCQIIRYF